MAYVELIEQLKKEYVLIKKSAVWWLFGGVVAFLLSAGYLSVAAINQVISGGVAGRATDRIGELEKVATEATENIKVLKEQLTEAYNEVPRIERGIASGFLEEAKRTNGRVEFKTQFLERPVVILTVYDFNDNAARYMIAKVLEVDSKGFVWSVTTRNEGELEAHNFELAWVAVSKNLLTSR